jgi:hypothetical protein
MKRILLVLLTVLAVPALFQTPLASSESDKAELKPIHFIQEGGEGGTYHGCGITEYRTTHGDLVSRGPVGTRLVRVFMPKSRLTLEKLTLTPDKRTLIARIRANDDWGLKSVIAEYAAADGRTFEYETTLLVRREPSRPSPCSTPPNPPLEPELPAASGPPTPAPPPPGAFSNDGVSFAGYVHDAFRPDSHWQWQRHITDDGWPRTLRFSVGAKGRILPPKLECDGFGPPALKHRKEGYLNHNGWFRVSAPVGSKGLVAGEGACTVTYPANPTTNAKALKTTLRFSVSPAGALRFQTGSGWTPPVSFIPPREEKYAPQRMRNEKAERKYHQERRR